MTQDITIAPAEGVNALRTNSPIHDTVIIEAAFAGRPMALQEAYPAFLRNRLKQKAMFHEANVADAHSSMLERIEVLFGAWGMPVLDNAFLNRLPALKAVFYAAGSVKSFATADFFKRGIILSHAAKANAIPVAEYAVATIILTLKRFWQHAMQARGVYSWKRLPVQGAYHSTVGLLSLGAVGSLTAQKLAQFDLDIIAFDPFVSAKKAAELGVQLVSLEEVFIKSDVVSLHTPLLPETRDLVDERLLRLMKSGATLINTSRGAIVNEEGLYQVLRERKDLTAVLDVTHPEPPSPSSPLFQLENVFLTPHISGSRGNEIIRMGEWMVEEFERYAMGEPLQHQVRQNMLQSMA